MNSLDELLGMSSVEFRADPSRTNRLLVGARALLLSADVETRRQIRHSVLEACLYSGPAALGAGDVARLLAPMLSLPPDPDEVDETLPALQAIAARDGMEKSPMLRDLLAQRGVGPVPVAAALPTDGVTPSVEAPDPDTRSDTFLDDPSQPIPSLAVLPEGWALERLSRHWRGLRSSTVPARRFDVDLWIIRSAVLARLSLDLDYCDQLRRDDEFWNDPTTQSLVSGLAAPFASAVGEVQAACLNSRLRSLRPRLFLDHPDAPILSTAGSRADLDEAQAALFDEISYPFLRSIRSLQNERRRGRAPRLTALDDIDTYLQTVLSRFGLRTLHHVGEEVEFDPERHLSGTPVDRGEPVVVLDPGLVEIKTGLVRVQAKTAPPMVEAESNQSQEQADE